MKTITKTVTTLSLAAIIGGFAALSGSTQAIAANDVKPMLTVEGKTYYKKQTATESAIGRWEKRAVIKHGIKYGKWNDARKTSMDCDSKFHQGNGKKLWTCAANGKPVAKIKMCVSAKLKATWYHSTEAGAKAGVRDAWEKGAAQRHGMKYSFYKNATDKRATCGEDSKYPGKVVCTLAGTPCK